MVCTSLQNKSLPELQKILSSGALELAEIRIDLCPDISNDEFQKVVSTHPIIATCRISSTMTADEAERKLICAVETFADYIDVEIEAPSDMVCRIAEKCRTWGVNLIRSVHFFEGTPSFETLHDCVLKCQEGYADIIKIVTYAHNADDVKVVQKLFTPSLAGRLTAFCMGEAGKQSRMDALKFGAPFTYAALSDAEATAAGQWTTSQMLSSLYGNDFPQYGFDNKNVVIPTSKSVAQRAVIASFLAEGESVIREYSPCGDSESALALIRNLGSSVSVDGSVLKIDGELDRIPQEVFVGESGFLTRFITPLLALSGRQITVKGEKTLVGRPLKGLSETMKSFGVEIDNDSVPFTIKGRLKASKTVVSGEYGSQLISGLIAALPLLQHDSEITVRNPKSLMYIIMTMNVLRKFGVEIECQQSDDVLHLFIRGGQKYKPANIKLEADWSGAAPMLIIGAVFMGIELKDLYIDSIQADKHIIKILQNAGAKVYGRGSTIIVKKSPLHSFKTDLNQAPDLFPVVSVLAAFSEGVSEISGLGRLAGKESDRAKAITEMLAQLGVKCTKNGDTLMVEGHSLSFRYANGKLLKGGNYTSSNDHRMVMALKIASLGADSKIIIDNEECVAKSFPEFNKYFK